MDNITKQSNFLDFFLSAATPKQQLALSKHFTQGQILILLEILHNIFNINHVEEADKTFYAKKKAFLKKFEKKRSFRLRKKLLISRIRTVQKILNHFKDKILELIR